MIHSDDRFRMYLKISDQVSESEDQTCFGIAKA